MLVKKLRCKWRICVNFTDLNKAYPKDSFPLPHIDLIVDLKVGHCVLSFMDIYSRYNQIRINPNNEKNTLFITNWGLYCYLAITF